MHHFIGCFREIEIQIFKKNLIGRRNRLDTNIRYTPLFKFQFLDNNSPK